MNVSRRIEAWGQDVGYIQLSGLKAVYVNGEQFAKGGFCICEGPKSDIITKCSSSVTLTLKLILIDQKY